MWCKNIFIIISDLIFTIVINLMWDILTIVPMWLWVNKVEFWWITMKGLKLSSLLHVQFIWQSKFYLKCSYVSIHKAELPKACSSTFREGTIVM